MRAEALEAESGAEDKAGRLRAEAEEAGREAELPALAVEGFCAPADVLWAEAEAEAVAEAAVEADAEEAPTRNAAGAGAETAGAARCWVLRTGSSARNLAYPSITILVSSLNTATARNKP